MKLSIIIVSWNVCKDVMQSIDSIYKNPPSLLCEIILVDNCSSDKTVHRVREKFPDVIVIENSQNLGFATANNIGIERAKGKYIFFLNPDTVILPDSFDTLISFMETDPSVGLCGPQILNPDRTIQCSARKFPTFYAIFYRFTVLKYLGLSRKYFHQWIMRDFDHTSQKEVEQLMGAALFAKTSLVKELGGFDEQFFMYYEEVDLCLRVKQAGKRVVFYPKSQIIHLGGQSAKQIPAKLKFMMLRSLVLFMKKHHPTSIDHLLILIFKIGIFVRQFIKMLAYLVVLLFSFTRPNKLRKNYSRLVSSFLFLVKYYINFLFT